MAARRPWHLRRRDVLAVGSATLALAFAGCTRVSEFVAEYYTGEINLFNTVERRITGSLAVAAPDGTMILDDEFDLAPGSGNAEEGEPAAIYDDVLTTAGSYQVQITADGSEASEHHSRRLQITAPDDEKIVVLLGGEFTGEFITMTVVEDFAELEDEFDEL